MHSIIRENISLIKKLCLQSEVKSLLIFGSVLNKKFKSTSDIDFMVDIKNDDPVEYSSNYFALKFNLENLLGRNIDLLEKSALTNSFIKREIQNTGILIYED